MNRVWDDGEWREAFLFFVVFETRVVIIIRSKKGIKKETFVFQL